MPGAFSKFTYSVFGKLIEQRVDYFAGLRTDLKRANIELLLEEYLSIALFASTAAFSFSWLGVYLLISSLFPAYPIAIKLPGALVLALSVAVSAFLIFLIYPSIAFSSIKKKIEKDLPFATIYMSTVAGAGIPPYLIFKLLGEFGEYGMVSREAKIIDSELEFVGKDLSETLRRAADRTPSEDFKELLLGLDTIIGEGGDVKGFLTSTSQALMRQYNRRVQEFGNSLSVYLEIYLTLIVVGSIFFLVMSSIMGAMGGAPAWIGVSQQVVVYLFLPLVTMAFILFVKVISPMG